VSRFASRLLVAALAATSFLVAQDTRPAAPAETRPAPADDDAPALTDAAIALADAGDFDGAVALLEKARKARPRERVTSVNLARMLGRRAASRLDARRDADAEADATLGLELAPEEAHLRVLRAGLWRRRGDVFRALGEATRAVEDAPADASTFEELARCKYDDDDLAGAASALDAAVKLDPSRKGRLDAFAAKLEREIEAEKAFRRVERGAFAVKYDAETFARVGDEILDLLDAAQQRAAAWFAHVPLRRVTVVLYSGREFTAVTGAHDWTGGLFDGKIRLPVRNFASSREGVLRTLKHEYMHCVVRDLTRHCPTWLNEGLAQIAEERRVADATAVLRGREPKRFAELPASWVTVKDGAEVSTWYAQSHAFVAWLMDASGPLTLKDLLTRLDGVKPFDKAFEETFGRTLAEAEDAWRATLR